MSLRWCGTWRTLAEEDSGIAAVRLLSNPFIWLTVRAFFSKKGVDVVAVVRYLAHLAEEVCGFAGGTHWSKTLIRGTVLRISNNIPCLYGDDYGT